MQEKIFTICEKLHQSGIKPTTEKVRSELGGGSFSAISQFIKQWKESHGQAELFQEIPPEAQVVLNQAAAMIWKIAIDHQKEAINAIRQEYASIEQEAAIEQAEALKEIKFLEGSLEVAQAQIEMASSEKPIQAEEIYDLQLKIKNQQFIIDSLNQANEELNAEINKLQKASSTVLNETSKENENSEAWGGFKFGI